MNLAVKKWFANFKKYLFFYRDGFFELPFLANSPEMIVQSFGKMPFVKNFPEQRTFVTNNLFLTGEGHYQQIEDGLWIIISSIKLKKDISFKLYYDDTYPADYHYLTLYVNCGQKEIKLPRLHFNVDFQDRAWTLYKKRTDCLNTHFAGQHSIYFTIYFSQEWLEANLSTNGLFKHEKLVSFFNSTDDYLYLPNFLESKKKLYQSIIDSIIYKEKSKNLLELKSMTYELMSSFVETLDSINLKSTQSNLVERDKRYIQKAQYIIEQAIFDSFPTINTIAKKIGISETKLKADFKTINGVSMYQYYLHKQMLYAQDLLKEKNLLVKEVANTLGYSSAGKFSQAFKNHFGYLPSDVL